MVKSFKTIVVPTDFSDSSQMALHYALDLVADDGRVILCHVVDDVPLTYGYVGISLDTPELRTKLASEAEKQLRSIIPSGTEGVDIDVRVLHGSPSNEIVELVRLEIADLVVMGTHGRAGVSHLLLGSVAEKVMRKSPSPVMVVREGGAGFEAA
jgi:nucleotide-binding universal stress UspA family protein